MKLNKLLQETVKAAQKHSPELLAAFGVINIVLAVGNAIRDTTKAMPKVYEIAESNENNEITFVELIKTAAPCYIPTITHTALAIGSVAMGAKISCTQKNMLATSLAASKIISSEYSKNVKALAPDVDRDAKINAANNSINQHEYREGDIIFIDDFTGKRFTATMSDVNNAEYEMNRLMQYKGLVSLNDFYKLIGLDVEPNSSDAAFGWCRSAEPFYGYKWIEFRHRFMRDPKNKSKEICRIYYTFEPHNDYTDIEYAATGDQLPFNV